MRKIFCPLIFALSAVLLAQPAVSAQEEDNAIEMYVGEMKQVPTNNPSSVVIGNPAIADVMSVGTQKITIAGKGAGMTNLLWWDAEGERSVRVKVLTEEMGFAKSRVDNLLRELNIPTVYTKPADAEGKVLLLGTVKTADEMKRIEAVLGENASKTVNLVTIEEEEAVVEMDVEVLEVDQDGRKQLGIEWPGSLTFNEPPEMDKKLSRTGDALFHISNWTHAAMMAKIDFLVSEGKARVLSKPKLACQSGKEAELLVGGETPILTTQVASTGGAASTDVEYKEYGIKLKIAPVVTQQDKVKLTIGVEVSDIAETALFLGSADAPTALAYPLTKRTTSTQLVLNDAQTLAVSGLIKQQFSEDVRKVPFLGDIPVLGILFRHRDTKRGKNAGSRGDTELVVMVTPRILRNGERVQQQSAAKTFPQTRQPVSEQAVAETMLAPAAQQTSFVQPAAAVDLTREGYINLVANYIAGKITYPSLAKRANIEGTVNLALHIARTGELLEAKISRSSGYPSLDADVLSTSRQISPYPGFPVTIREKDIWIQVPISYKLTGNK